MPHETPAHVAPGPAPLRAYPGVGEALSELTVAMAGIVRSQTRTERDVSRWVAREMHAATAHEIDALVADAALDVIAATPPSHRPRVVRRLDALRSEVAKQATLTDASAPRLLEAGDELVEGILGIIAIVDADLHEHLGAVGALSARIAVAMGEDAEVVRTCTVVGKLHDIGKLAVHRSLLEKPSSLGLVESAIVRRHADAGYRMLASIPSLQRYAQAVRTHHERLNGSGYPSRLAGDAICLEARIVAVADVFHAMTSPRAYREPLEPKAALEEIVRGRGTLYDAAVVDAALRVFGARIGVRSLAS